MSPGRGALVAFAWLVIACDGAAPSVDDAGETPSPSDAAAGDAASDAAPSPREEALLSVGPWERIPAADDPWLAWRPADDACPRHVPRVEENLIEFDTGACPAWSVRRASLAAVDAGDTVRLVAWHSVLLSSAAGTGHFEVHLDGDPLIAWETPIPAPLEFFTVEAIAPRDYPAGVPVDLHVRNHGANTWHLSDLRVRRASTP